MDYLTTWAQNDLKRGNLNVPLMYGRCMGSEQQVMPGYPPLLLSSHMTCTMDAMDDETSLYGC